jgi:antitoxin component YwqK of YwqJK toxin-antitoxin module
MNRLLPPMLFLLLTACGSEDPANGTKEGPAAPATRQTPAEPPTDGIHEMRDAEGRLTMKGPMRNGQRHGLWTAYGNDGSVRSQTTYQDGVEHGAAVVFRPNGTMHYTGDNHNGRPVGEWQFFNTNGDLAQIVVYDSLGNEVDRRR